MLAALHQECSGFKHALISSEELSHAFLDPAVLEQFCRLARDHFHVRVIIYLRRQDKLKESIYAQVAREWFCGSILDENHYEYDHLKRLNLLRTQIPKHDLIVQRYLSGTAVEQDFLAIYAVALGNGFTLKPRKNVSWNRRITAILGRLDKREVRYPGRFLRHLACQDICADDGIRYLMSPQQRRTFLEQYERTNREVAEQYFPELKGELFERADNEDTNWVPVSLPSEDECQRLIRSLWDDYSRNFAVG